MERRGTFLSLTPHLCCLLLIVLLSLVVSACSASLSFDFYAASCPSAEFIVSNTVRSASSNDPTIPGKLLRLLFHDCFVEVSFLLVHALVNTNRGVVLVHHAANRHLGKMQCTAKLEAVVDFVQGCDASVLLQGNGTERSDPANGSLGGFAVINSAKRVLEIFCPGTVSCADIVALAARDAVAVTGGPLVQIPTGRRDGKVSASANVRPNIVDTSFTMDEMVKVFSTKGLSLDDLVVLSGAHTIGAAHCNAFSDRFQEDSKGNLRLVDSSLDNTYANELLRKCPVGASPSVTVSNDPETSAAFDNQYYRNLLAHRGLFQSDSALLDDPRTRKQVEDLANDQDKFFASWSQSFLKLTSIGVKNEEEGEIRQSCSVVNG